MAAPADIYAALYRVRSYPRWWPEFREVTPVGPGRHRMIVRSFLPYRIRYVLTEEIADEANGVLEGTVDGDIVGRIGWKIDPAPGGSIVRFREVVETRLDVLNLLAPVARWAFEGNHQLMMRDGLVGLKAFIAGASPVRQAPPARQPGEDYR